ncbi:MAG: OmpH family outer membrane protein [Bacteroidia bacterium]|nr:OmpH family outer membrane protein [Bacteroidia bacterium]
MKTIHYVIIALIFTASSTGLFAQGKLKFGHIDSQALLEVMPERTNAVKELQKHAGELEETLTSMQKEYETKLAEYMAKKDSISDFLKKNKEEELQLMGQRIEEFRTKANQNIQKKKSELLEPNIKKARQAITDVAKEQGLIYVFDVAEAGGGMIVLYHSEESTDILPLVKKKLGITN